MKISDIITEATKLRKGAQRATPDMQSWPALNNNNSPYAAYRFGLALASSPDRAIEKNGPIGGDFTTIGYTTADQEIMDAAAKFMGVTPKQQTSKNSIELDSVSKKSPVRSVGPIQRKSK